MVRRTPFSRIALVRTLQRRYTICMTAETGIDLEKVRTFLKEKTERRRKAVDERFACASRDFDKIVADIIAQVNPFRIYQWGSLLHRKRFSEISDIDIAVQGLKGPEEFFEVLGIAMDGTPLPVDVVEIEKLPCDVAKRIRKQGRVVYERRGS
jgi:uncharacterized protein